MIVDIHLTIQRMGLLSLIQKMKQLYYYFFSNLFSLESSNWENQIITRKSPKSCAPFPQKSKRLRFLAHHDVRTCLFYTPHQSNNQTSVFPPSAKYSIIHIIFLQNEVWSVQRESHATLIENGLRGWNTAGHGVFHLLCVMHSTPSTPEKKMAPHCTPLLPDP